MPDGGRIIFVTTGITTFSSVTPNYLLYATCKGAIEQMTRVMAKDLAPKGIRVNALGPGPTATEFFFRGKTDQVIEAIKREILLVDLVRSRKLPTSSCSYVASRAAGSMGSACWRMEEPWSNNMKMAISAILLLYKIADPRLEQKWLKTSHGKIYYETLALLAASGLQFAVAKFSSALLFCVSTPRFRTL